MKTDTVFYGVGILFALATILYFTWEYLFDLARSLKIIILALLTLFFWFMAGYLKERDVYSGFLTCSAYSLTRCLSCTQLTHMILAETRSSDYYFFPLS